MRRHGREEQSPPPAETLKSRILEIPLIYSLVQVLAGANAAKRRLVEQFIEPLHPRNLLDIGCGPAHMIEFLPADIEYVGTDLNPRYIESARAKYGDRGKFFCSSIEDMSERVESLSTFDLVLVRGVLHHINDEVAGRLFVYARRCLAPGGQVLSSDPVYLEGQSRLAQYVMSKDRGQHIRSRDHYLRLAGAYFPSVECFIRDDMLRLPYTHLIMLMSDGASRRGR